MQFANTARGGNGQNNAKFGFDTDVVRVDATEVQRGQPVLINYKWPTAAWDEIESRIVGLCAWEGYDGDGWAEPCNCACFVFSESGGGALPAPWTPPVC